MFHRLLIVVIYCKLTFNGDFLRLKLRLKLSQPISNQTDTLQDRKSDNIKDSTIISGQERIKLAKKFAMKHGNDNTVNYEQSNSNSNVDSDSFDGKTARENSIKNSYNARVKEEPMDLDNSEINNANGINQSISSKFNESDDISDPPGELLEAVKHWLNETFDRSIYSLETLKRRLLLHQSS